MASNMHCIYRMEAIWYEMPCIKKEVVAEIRKYGGVRNE